MESTPLFKLDNFCHTILKKSIFFQKFSNGEINLKLCGKIFGQYYIWRNAFHRWFGVCIVRSAPFGSNINISYILKEMSEHIITEINQDHYGLCKKFLIGINVDPQLIKPIHITTKYISSFENYYLKSDQIFENAVAALAGRELFAAHRNKLFVSTLTKNFDLDKESLEFWDLHQELEMDHFQKLWHTIAIDKINHTQLILSAQSEIKNHCKFWDALYFYYMNYQDNLQVNLYSKFESCQ